MTTVLVQHSVADYGAWKAVFDEHGAVRRAHGQLAETVLQSADDPNLVQIILSWPSAEAAQAFLADASLREAMGRAGVVGAPRIELYEEASV